MNSLFSGLAIIILAALFQGSFAVPMAYARGWKWENSWLVFSVFGMIVFNIVFAFAAIPMLFGVYGASEGADILMPALWGLVWGVGAIGFGLGITSAGLALGYAILLGTVLSMGTFIPMAVLYPGEIMTPKGMLIITGLLVTLSGIATSGYAGIIKEREQGGSAGEITKTGRFSVKVGILICFVAGLCSSVINIGFSLSRPLVETALSHGAPPLWAGNAIWALMFTTGGILNISYCAYLMGKNGTSSLYREKGSSGNFVLLLLMSLMWIGSFILYGVGATMMGSWGTVIGWSVYMALSISIGNLWGIFQGEWQGASERSKRIMIRGFITILAAIVIFAFGGSL